MPHQQQRNEVFGDPTFMGWAIAAFYVFASGLAFRARGRAIRIEEQRFWAWCSLALMLLAINKQADAQTWLTGIGRELAYSGGWYDARRPIQKAFIVILSFGFLIGLGYASWCLRATARQVRTALMGLTLIGLYVMVRAASFHHIDELLMSRIGLVRAGLGIELTGLFVTAAAAARFRRTKHHEED
jgi:hypothetical protein